MTGESIRPNRTPQAEIVRGLIFAGVMLAASGGAKLLTSMGVLTDTTWPQRLTMMLLGAFLIAIGNDLPRTMRPLASLTCDPARLQRFQRLAGYSWVATGGTVALAWLALPVTAARPITVAIIGAGVAFVGILMLQLHNQRRQARGLARRSESPR